MGLYSRRRGGGGGLYSGAAGAGGGLYSRAKKDGGASGWGFIENLAGDVRDTLINIPGGVVETVRNPIKTGKAVGRSYAQTYGPLFRGELGKFAHNLYDHPLGPILDIAAFATVGGAAAGRAAGLAGKAGTRSIELRGPGRLAAEGRLKDRKIDPELQDAPDVLRGKTLSRNPVTRGRQAAIDKLLKSLPPDTPVVGELRRFARELDRAPRQDTLRLRIKLRPYQRAFGKLKRHEKVALSLIARGVTPDEYKGLLLKEREAGNSIREDMLGLLDNAEVRKAFENPSERLLKAADLARDAGGVMADVLIQTGRLTPETVAERPFLHARLVGDQGEFIPGGGDRDQMSLLGDPKEEISARLEKEGRPQPFYLADIDVQGRPVGFGRTGGGAADPRRPGSTQQNRAVLFRLGQLALDVDQLSPAYLRAIKYDQYRDTHRLLIEHAVRVAEGLPKGHVFIRRPKEKISYTERTRGEFERNLEELVPEETDLTLEGLVTKTADEALEENGVRLAVPESVVRRVAGEYQKSNKALDWFLTKPGSVWRAIILGTRPAYLVNNLVGSTLLYTLRNAGPQGLRAYLNALRASGAGTKIESLLRDPKTRNLVDKDLMEEFFPEQIEGTFGATQFPAGFKGKLKKVERPFSGLTRASAANEGLLRRAAVEAALRKNPAVRKRLKEMPQETRSFRAAARKELESNPQLAREVSDKVNDALGNYLDLSHAERTYIRSLSPFYAWYRAITVVTAKMPGLQADVLNKLSQVGKEVGVGEVPSYLEGALPLGEAEGDLQRILTTQAQNPWATVPDVAYGLGGLLPGVGGRSTTEFAQLLSPFLVAAANELARKPSYLPRDESPYGLPGDIALEVAKSLPLTRLLFPPGPSDLYPKRDRQDELLSQLGLPIKKMSRNEARRRRKRGD